MLKNAPLTPQSPLNVPLSDTDSEELRDDSADEFDELYDDESVVSNKIGQGVFDFNPMDLAADLTKEWSYENDNNNLNRADKCVDNDSNIVDEDISENLSTIENCNENSVSLPIALRKTCHKNLKDNK